MSLQDLGSNYPEGVTGNCNHGMPDDGIDCIQCAVQKVFDYVAELDIIYEHMKNKREGDCDDIPVLLKGIKAFLNKINPEIESWKRVVVKLTKEKYMLEQKCDHYEKVLSVVKNRNPARSAGCQM